MTNGLARGHNITATVFVECMTSFRVDGDVPLRPVGETEFVVANAIGCRAVRDPRRCRHRRLGRSHESRRSGPHARRTNRAGAGRFRGVRFNVVWLDNRDATAHAGRVTVAHMLLDDRYRAGLREVARRDLTYDVWLYHLNCRLVDARCGAGSDLLVNHLGGPVPTGNAGCPRRDLRRLAAQPARGCTPSNVVLKVGGVGMPVYGFGLQDGGVRTRPH
jgi:hypothetical protein